MISSIESFGDSGVPGASPLRALNYLFREAATVPYDHLPRYKWAMDLAVIWKQSRAGLVT
jgi:hypothetical protein